MEEKIIIDAGHGGANPGATYEGPGKVMMPSALHWPLEKFWQKMDLT